MKNLFEEMLLKEKIEFKGSVEQLEAKLNVKESRRFGIKWIANGEFVFFANLSVGISRGNRIQGYGHLQEVANEKILITLTTSIRPEMYFIAGGSIFVLIASFFTEEKFPVWAYSLLPFSLIWFWFVYRFQEKMLFTKVKARIKDVNQS